MARDHFTGKCQNCGGGLSIQRLICPECGLKLEGGFNLPRLARLSPEDREFIELFVLSAGSLKEVGRQLKVSYPTVRARLDSVIAALKSLDEGNRRERIQIIQRLQEKQITVDEASQLLAALA